MHHALFHRLLTPLSGLLLLLSALVCHADSSRYSGFDDVETSGFRYPFPEPSAAPAPQAVKASVATPKIEAPKVLVPKPLVPKPLAPKTISTPRVPVPKVPVPRSTAKVEPNKALPNAPSLDTVAPVPDKSLSIPLTLPPITGRVAIIIDDIGYSLKYGLLSARFPAPLTLAILPHSPNGLALAELGHEKGKSIMLHAPMSTVHQSPLDAGGLTESMNEEEFMQTLRNSLNSLPHVSGVNNHMGSYLTQLEEPMNWVMNELKQRELFFIDSRTSAESQAWEVAQAHGITSRKRDVFLDNERDPQAIADQFAEMIAVAKRRGSAVAIGHPYPETLSVLQEHIPLLRSHGIELVSIEALLQTPARTTLSRNP